MTTTRAAALSIGALLGPSLLLVPGLAAAIAGPASIVDWVALLVLSGLFAWVFTALGRRVRAGGGVAAYAAAGLGVTAGRIVAWCFLAGVVLGAPVVCLVGGSYVAAVFSGGPTLTVAVAAGLLAAVVAVTLAGARSSTTVQLALVAVLIVLVAVAVVGSAGASQLVHWTPFAPHGVRSIGDAASVLMLSFVGWEAMASIAGSLQDVDRQLPRVVVITFVVTAVLYLSLAVATISVLGPRAGDPAPLAALLEVAVGPAGAVVAAVAAVVLTLAGTNAYLTGAAELTVELRPGTDRRVLQLAVAVVGALVLGAVAVGAVSLTELVAVPTDLFLAVYLGCTVSGVRVLTGPVRVASGVAAVATVVVLGFSGWALLAVAVVGVAVLTMTRSRRQRIVSSSSTTSPTTTCSARRTASLSGTR